MQHAQFYFLLKHALESSKKSNRPHQESNLEAPEGRGFLFLFVFKEGHAKETIWFPRLAIHCDTITRCGHEQIHLRTFWFLATDAVCEHNRYSKNTRKAQFLNLLVLASI